MARRRIARSRSAGQGGGQVGRASSRGSPSRGSGRPRLVDLHELHQAVHPGGRTGRAGGCRTGRRRPWRGRGGPPGPGSRPPGRSGPARSSGGRGPASGPGSPRRPRPGRPWHSRPPAPARAGRRRRACRDDWRRGAGSGDASGSRRPSPPRSTAPPRRDSPPRLGPRSLPRGWASSK